MFSISFGNVRFDSLGKKNQQNTSKIKYGHYLEYFLALDQIFISILCNKFEFLKIPQKIQCCAACLFSWSWFAFCFCLLDGFLFFLVQFDRYFLCGEFFSTNFYPKFRPPDISKRSDQIVWCTFAICTCRGERWVILLYFGQSANLGPVSDYSQ